MLTCIACSKALEEPICETELNCCTTPTSRASKETINNLSAKIKDLALKLSGAYRQSRPFARSSIYLKGTPQRSLEPDEETSELTKSNEKGAPGTPKFESLGGRPTNIVLEEAEECKEWIVEVEPGVVITFLSLPKSKTHLKRVRFSKEVFDKWSAQLWWLENYDKIVELFDVQRTSREALCLLTKSEYEEKRSIREATQHSLSMPPRRVLNINGRRRPGGRVALGHYSSDLTSKLSNKGAKTATPSMEDRTKTSSSEDGDPSLSAKLSHALLVSTTDSGASHIKSVCSV